MYARSHATNTNVSVASSSVCVLCTRALYTCPCGPLSCGKFICTQTKPKIMKTHATRTHTGEPRCGKSALRLKWVGLKNSSSSSPSLPMCFLCCRQENRNNVERPCMYRGSKAAIATNGISLESENHGKPFYYFFWLIDCGHSIPLARDGLYLSSPRASYRSPNRRAQRSPLTQHGTASEHTTANDFPHFILHRDWRARLLFIVLGSMWERAGARALARAHVRDGDEKHVLRAELKVCNAPCRSNRTLVANNRLAPLHDRTTMKHMNVWQRAIRATAPHTCQCSFRCPKN